MKYRFKKFIWVVLLLIATIFGMLSIILSALPKNVQLADGSTTIVYQTGTTEIVCFVISSVFLVASLLAGINLRKGQKD